LRAGDPRRRLCLSDRLGGLVGEAVHIRHLQRVEQHPVEACEVADTALEGLGMSFRPVARGRAREVDRIEFPRPRARGLEAKLGRHLCAGHWMSSPCRCWAAACKAAPYGHVLTHLLAPVHCLQDGEWEPPTET